MKVVDLFSGCGGLSLGLMNAGHAVVAAFDNWEPALAVYRENIREHPAIQQDLSDVSSSVALVSKYRPQVVAGGPPCQDFSSAGLRNYRGKRADLTHKFTDIVCQVSPKFFVMENVERIRKTRVLAEIIKQFSEAGYGLTAVVLDASYCGAPQARLRFFLIGHRRAPHNFLSGYLESALSEKPMTMRDYFGDTLGIQYYYRHPRNYNRRAIYGLDEPSATIRGVNRPIPPGYALNANDPVGISLSDVRPLTTAERARVQTFPSDFKFLGNRTAQEQMIGNAVPVALGQFVGRALSEYTESGFKPLSLTDELFQDDALKLPERPLRPVGTTRPTRSTVARRIA